MTLVLTTMYESLRKTNTAIFIGGDFRIILTITIESGMTIYMLIL